jgi:hypothetical protein
VPGRAPPPDGPGPAWPVRAWRGGAVRAILARSG